MKNKTLILMVYIKLKTIQLLKLDDIINRVTIFLIEDYFN